jgi:hypothetical protein
LEPACKLAVVAQVFNSTLERILVAFVNPALTAGVAAGHSAGDRGQKNERGIELHREAFGSRRAEIECLGAVDLGSDDGEANKREASDCYYTRHSSLLVNRATSSNLQFRLGACRLWDQRDWNPAQRRSFEENWGLQALSANPRASNFGEGIRY